MQEILEKYKERLINISGRNRSLVLKKLYKKSSFDIYKLKKFNENIDEKVIEFITERKGGKLCILHDPYKWKEEESRRLKKEIRDELNRNIEILSVVETEKVKLEEYKNEAQKKLAVELEKVESKTKEIIDYSQSLSYLLREINSTEKETGRYELYIGYPFVEGCFKDNTFVKAPLILFPVKVFKQADTWFIENIKDQSIILNKVFLLAYSKYNSTTLDSIETEFEDFKDNGYSNVEKLLDYLEDNNVDIRSNGDQKVIKFFEHSSDTKIDYKPGELILKNYLILGQFPLANSIYNDYVELGKRVICNEQLNKLLINSNTVNISDFNGYESEKIREQDYYFITNLDYSQEKAVKKVNTSSQLVIYGPPGTGKSQTIANIISDGLSKGKKILMVSQKRAALDVIFNRLSKINSKVILLHDASKDKKLFYETLTKQLESLNDLDYMQILRRIEFNSKEIDKNIDILNEIHDSLHKQRDFGLTLQQMYSKTKNPLLNMGNKYQDFKTFRNNVHLHNFKYQDLVYSIRKISSDYIIEKYRKFKVYESNYRYVHIIRKDLNSYRINDFIEKLQEIKRKYNRRVCIPVENRRNVDIVLKLYLQSDRVDDIQISSLARDINHKENGSLLVKLNNGRWWSLYYWLNYNKNKKQEQINNIEYKNREVAIKNNLIELNNLVKSILNDISFIKNIVLDHEYDNLRNRLLRKENITLFIDDLINTLRIYEEYRSLAASFKDFSHMEMKLLEYGYKNTNSSIRMSELLKSVPEYAILINIDKIEQAERDILIRFKDLKNLREEIICLSNEKQSLLPEYLIKKWDKQAIRAFAMDNARRKELYRQSTKKRALWPLRKFIEKFDDMLFEVFPCWLLGPETVSEILPLKQEMFDLIIFDEASQMFVENSIPTIYRGKRIVVAGDDKQLKPSSIFKVKIEDNEEHDEIDTSAAYEEESLLDLAKVNYDSVKLNYHYRSKYEELINFSNYAFYGAGLEISPNVVKMGGYSERPIERIKVEGKWIGRKNTTEAEEVVKLVEKILMNRKENETLGIITFNVTQKDLIDDMLENRASKDENFRSLFYKELERKEGNEDVSLFVKNIENVQGDERDIIIFSTGYAPNENGKLRVNFGSLSQDGGENRLNVAISRAKKKIYLITSIEPEELNVEDTINNGPKLLKKYLQYVREVSNGNNDAAVQILNSLLDTGISRQQFSVYDSDFENQVCDALREKGYEIDTQVGVSGYKIDLAIFDRRLSRYILGIECDGATYHSSKSARERDIHRQRYLEQRGWRIARIWSRDWWENPQGEIRRLQEIIRSSREVFAKETQVDELELNEQISKVNNKVVRLQDVKNKKDIIHQDTILSQRVTSTSALLTVGYGDRVRIKDVKTGETFTIKIENNPANRMVMKEIEKILLGRQLNQSINFSGVCYRIEDIEKQANEL